MYKRQVPLTSLKLKTISGGNIADTIYTVDTPVTQTIGVGSTAIGYVASWDSTSAVLKLYTPTGIGSTTTGFRMVDFDGTSNQLTISGQTSGNALSIDDAFTGNSVTINGASVSLGQAFTKGVAPPEVKKYSGEVLYIDNRAAIQRSATQKEDVKIVLEF